MAILRARDVAELAGYPDPDSWKWGGTHLVRKEIHQMHEKEQRLGAEPSLDSFMGEPGIQQEEEVAAKVHGRAQVRATDPSRQPLADDLDRILDYFKEWVIRERLLRSAQHAPDQSSPSPSPSFGTPIWQELAEKLNPAVGVDLGITPPQDPPCTKVPGVMDYIESSHQRVDEIKNVIVQLDERLHQVLAPHDGLENAPGPDSLGLSPGEARSEELVKRLYCVIMDLTHILERIRL